MAENSSSTFIPICLPNIPIMATVTLNDLAAKVTDLSQNFTKYLEEKHIPQPTLAADSPVSYTGLDGPSFILRQQLIDALNDMWILTQGPSESIFNYVHNVRKPISPQMVLTRIVHA